MFLAITTEFLCYKALAQTENWSQTIFPTNFATSVETTPWGIFAGERDERPHNQSHNGLYFSADFGHTWQPHSMQKRKVTDIHYSNGKLYVTTKDFYERTVGLFMSDDGGANWTQLGPNYSAYSVSVYENTILLGTGSHGLLVSHDNGTTWEQKIGDGILGPDIFEIQISSDFFIAVSNTKVYKSEDLGNSWYELPALTNKNIRYIQVNKNVILAGSSSSGLYISNDKGTTWQVSQEWGNSSVGTLFYFKGIYYAGKKNSSDQFSVYKSVNASVWEDTELNLINSNGHVVDMTGIYASSDSILTATQNQGIYKYNVPLHISDSQPFLNIPWPETSLDNLIDKITSYFDHNLPLLGYRYHAESIENNKSTINYIGLEDYTPTLHYSSHDGYDFALPYGTSVLAAADGYAIYYYCNDCGNTIKINHQNGYQTIYMHLQNQDLITTNDIPVYVKSGEAVGKVGMTGKTSGPHLHFAVLKDKNNNGTFIDDFPTGKVDPFGWQSYMFKDPWENYTWEDLLGQHSGSKSKYLWNSPLAYLNSTYNDEAFIEFANKKISITSNSTGGYFTVYAGNHGKPILPKSQQHLIYIPGTSFFIELYNIAGEKISRLMHPATIEIDFSTADVSNVLDETIKIYRYNPKVMLWEPTGSFLLDLVEKRVAGETDEFSHFAVFAEKIDAQAPNTQIHLSGLQHDGWYIETPIISFTTLDNSSQNSSISTYYKIGEDPNWYEYIEPFTLQDGILGIEYKSVDESGNWETPKDILLKIDTSNSWKSDVLIKNSSFNVQHDILWGKAY